MLRKILHYFTKNEDEDERVAEANRALLSRVDQFVENDVKSKLRFSKLGKAAERGD